MTAIKKKQQHLTVFLIKRNVKSFEDALKPNGGAGSAIPLNSAALQGSLYLPTPDENPPGWLPFVQSGFPGQDVVGNRMASALIFLRIQGRIFALSFGHARHFLDANAFERDFGLRVVVNRVSQDKIRGVTLRMFKETHVRRQEEAAKGTDLQSFGIDTQQDLLRGVAGVPADNEFASRVSGADCLSIDVALDFEDLPAKCKELLVAYSDKGYAQRGFSWIDNLRAVREPALIDQLDSRLVKALKQKDGATYMLCPDSLNRDALRGFRYKEDKADTELHTELEMGEWRKAIASELTVLTVDQLRERRIRAYDLQSSKISEINERDCFVFETNMKGAKYILSSGEWFEVATTFDDEISKYIEGISKTHLPLPTFSPTWKGKKGEDRYVAEAAKATEFMSMHKKTHPIGGASIEPCDLLHSSGALVHVKLWTQSATFSHLLAQGAVSAEALLRYPEFREHVVRTATKHKHAIAQLFPTSGFVTSKLDVVLALVREISKPLPFFSRLNLMREAQRIERLGYRVSYQRIEVQ
jgi:uncharacterized protein (TIGR04141 family)